MMNSRRNPLVISQQPLIGMSQSPAGFFHQNPSLLNAVSTNMYPPKSSLYLQTIPAKHSTTASVTIANQDEVSSPKSYSSHSSASTVHLHRNIKNIHPYPLKSGIRNKDKGHVDECIDTASQMSSSNEQVISAMPFSSAEISSTSIQSSIIGNHHEIKVIKSKNRKHLHSKVDKFNLLPSDSVISNAPSGKDNTNKHNSKTENVEKNNNNIILIEDSLDESVYEKNHKSIKEDIIIESSNNSQSSNRRTKNLPHSIESILKLNEASILSPANVKSGTNNIIQTAMMHDSLQHNVTHKTRTEGDTLMNNITAMDIINCDVKDSDDNEDDKNGKNVMLNCDKINDKTVTENPINQDAIDDDGIAPICKLDQNDLISDDKDKDKHYNTDSANFPIGITNKTSISHSITTSPTISKHHRFENNGNNCSKNYKDENDDCINSTKITRDTSPFSLSCELNSQNDDTEEDVDVCIIKDISQDYSEVVEKNNCGSNQPEEHSIADISKHLKRLEGLIFEEDSTHFRKDGFHQAKVQILRSVSNNCKITPRHNYTSNNKMPCNNISPSLKHQHMNKTPINHFRSSSGLHQNHPISRNVEQYFNQCGNSIHPCKCPVSNPFIADSHNIMKYHNHHPYATHYNCSKTVENNNHNVNTINENNYKRKNPLITDIIENDYQKSAFKPILKPSLHSCFIPLSDATSLNIPQMAPVISPSYNSLTAIHSQQAVSNLQNRLPSLHSNLKIPSSNLEICNLIPSNRIIDHNNIKHQINSIDSNTLAPIDAISLMRLQGYMDTHFLNNSSFPYCFKTHPNVESQDICFELYRSKDFHLINNSLPSNSDTITSPLTKSTSQQQQPSVQRYHCSDCNKTYSTFGGLSKHKQFHCALHIKKEFGCKICPKSYSSLGALKMHIRTHTLPCKCHICGKAFSRPWLLQGHVRTHTGEKPFRCQHCGRAFADRSNLRAHLQTHAEIKKYACVRCGKTFSRMSLLTKHSEGSCPANANGSVPVMLN